MQVQMMSRLGVSYSKSDIFCSGISKELQLQLSSAMELRLGILPVCYLGVPLVSGKISHIDCIPLIDKITARISSWSSRFLTFAGRFQLINSILASVYSYWCNIFLLPK